MHVSVHQIFLLRRGSRGWVVKAMDCALVYLD